MNRITSSDGTTIAFDRPGADPAVVIIGAGPTGRSAHAPVAQLLSDRGLPVTKLAVWEPPYYLDDEPRRPPADYRPGHPDAGW